MPKSIWDLKVGECFTLKNGVKCQVLIPTADGKGFVAKYLEKDKIPDLCGHEIGDDDFVFEDEMALAEKPN